MIPDVISALKCGTLPIDRIASDLEMAKRNKYLARHAERFNIWQGKTDGLYYTYLPDRTKKKGIRLVKRTRLDALEKTVIEYWKEQEKIVTVGEMITAWIDRRYELGYISDSTKTRYYKDYARYFKDIRDVDIAITSPAYFAEFLEDSVSREHLKSKAFSNLKTILNGGLNTARKKGHINFGSAEVLAFTEIPRKMFASSHKEDEDDVFSEEETEKLIEYFTEHPDAKNLCLLLTVLTGCRIGEMTTAKHSDFSGNIFHVSRTQTRYADENGKYRYDIKDSPKTQAGFRSTVVPTDFSWVLEKLEKLNPESEYIFLDRTGKPFSSNIMNNRLKSVCKKIGIKPRSPHKLRKTYASILLDNGVNASTVIKLMGHTDIRTTEQYYYRNRRDESKIIDMISSIDDFRTKKEEQRTKLKTM